jgi:hypothetical protein
MVPCTRVLWKLTASKHNPSQKDWDYRKCAKKSTRYFRVEYLETNRDNNDKKFDIFALCEYCASEAVARGDAFWFPKGKQSKWGGVHWMASHPVFKLRGKISSYAEVQGSESTFRNDLKERRRAQIKASFMSTMKQDTFKCITPDEWKSIFTDLYEEFVVSSVLSS